MATTQEMLWRARRDTDMKLIQVLKAKINNAIITGLQLEYEGSIGIDEEIIAKVNVIPGERVQVLNYNNGSRIETYVIPEKKGSKKIVLYGPAARCGEVGDRLCILAYYLVDEQTASKIKPRILELGSHNSL